jgi:hypothetical protein
MTDDSDRSLRDAAESSPLVFDDNGFIDAVVAEYGDVLGQRVLVGEELDIENIGKGGRKYTYGDGDGRTVSQVGVEIGFDAELVESDALYDGGHINTRLRELATEHFGEEPLDVDFTNIADYPLFGDADAGKPTETRQYIVWVITSEA